MTLTESCYRILTTLAISGVIAADSYAVAPYTEDFATDTANWADTLSGALTFVPSGSVDSGSYVSTVGSFSDPNAVGDSVVLFRGHDEFGFSGGAFEGNWAADGIRTVTAQVRHSAPGPLSFFMRASGPGNFPGAVAIEFVPVLPDTWTEISFDVSPSSFQFVTYEGSNWTSVFSNVGHVQFGVSISAAMSNGVPVTFDIDKITTGVPEPSAICLAGLPLIGMCGFYRSRK